ncbi:lipocalin family protein [Marixanthomonas sp. SCSIO 43207]|uniref:lipocalin family protein n=1 Tax=Marixanthomonas sp. SCSIO 43207 TaxID=2779360 RepID=UPI001CA95290|nr:lipocalin family protein [Marixanthomonas sp. SCSIO 43207]UAB80569.1 lipocalin family protein [Marixanthomonas sp. SCSIO 43207]
MKKLFVLAVVVMTAISCGVPKTVSESRKIIKGYWALDNITYSESGEFNVSLLGDTSKECFEGSTWRFIPNNNTGVYTINNGECPTGDRNFIFTIQEVDPTTGLYDFLLKPTNAKGKSPDNTGFRLRLAQLNESTMRWEQTVSLEGSPFTINMNFTKINE